MYIKYMNIALDLSKAQLSKLRNGHGIRINPTMLGRGIDLIIDPMTYHNLSKKLDKDKGAIIKMGLDEIEQNKMQGTGLFAGAGNKSGKISRFKKGNKWKGFAKELVNDGMDLGERGLEIFNKQKERQSPMGQFKRAFGGGEYEDMEGGKISFSGLKNAYNKNVKNTALGKAVRQSAENLISDGFDRATEEVGKFKNLKPLAEHMGKTRQGSVRKATQMSGLGAGKGRRRSVPDMPQMRTADMPRGRGLRLSHGDGMRLSGNGMTMGGRCCGCGAMMNDKFIFENQAL